MVVAVLSDELLKEEFLSKPVPSGIELVWADSIRSLGIIEADAYFDLAFDNDPERTAHLKKLLHHPVIINSVTDTCKTTDPRFARINAWPTMLKREIAEVAVADKSLAVEVKMIFDALNRRFQLVPDTPGMVTPRVVAMIINEAWYAFGEGISTKDEIDTAMKLGTNYPFGPFEWGRRLAMSGYAGSLMN